MLNVSIAYMESFLTRLKHVQVTEIVVDVQGGSVRITGTSEL